MAGEERAKLEECHTMKEPFALRRAALLEAMAASGAPAVAVLPAAAVFPRNNDVEHEYRQDSDFYYLTGFDEPESVAVVDSVERTFTLFVRSRDPDREIWDGPRAGVDGAKAISAQTRLLPLESWKTSSLRCCRIGGACITDWVSI